MKKITVNLFVFFFFLLLAFVYTSPSIKEFDTKLIGDGLDNYIWLFDQHLANINLNNIHFPFQYTNILRYPHGFDFARGFDGVLFILVGAFFRFILNPFASYNLALIIVLAFSCYLTYVFFYEIVKSHIIALVGGVMYGLSFFSLARGAGHPNIMFIGCFPFLLYSIIRLKFNHKLIDFLNLAISVLLIAFASLQHLLMLIIIFLINILLIPIFFKNDLLLYISIFKNNLQKVLISGIFFISVFSLFFSPTIKSFAFGSFENADRIKKAEQNSIYLNEFVLPNPFTQTYLSKVINSGTQKSIENIVFVGYIELLIFIVFLLFVKKDKKYFYITLNVFIFFVLSLGIKNPDLNIFLPLSFIYKFFPFSFIPESGRYFIIFYLFMSLGIVLILKRIENKKIIILLVLILIIAERITPQYYTSPTIPSTFGKTVSAQPGEAVLDLPISFDEPVYDYLPIIYNKKIISGNFFWSADSPSTRAFINESEELSRFLCNKYESANIKDKYRSKKFLLNEENLNQKLLLKLVENNIRTIVVHKDDPFKLYDYQNCLNVWLRVSSLIEENIILSPTESETKFIGQSWPISRVNFLLNLPYKGVFTIEKIDMYTSEPVNLLIKMNGKAISTKLHDPIKVEEKSEVSIKSDKIFHKGYIKLFYRYDVSSFEPSIDNYLDNKKIEIKKIYSDINTDVYSL